MRSESELEEYSPSSDESASGFHLPEKKVRYTRKFDLDFAMARYRVQLAQQRERRQPESGEGGKDKPAIAPTKKATSAKKQKSQRRRPRAVKESVSSRSQQ